MRYLVDAKVLSEPTRAIPNANVLGWLRSEESQIAVNPIIIGEIEYGILQLAPSARRRRLEEWFSEGIQRLHHLDFDRTTASEWAKLLARLRRSGKAMPIKDSLIAASALANGLTVATRDTNDFRHAGVRLLNPFDLGPR